MAEALFVVVNDTIISSLLSVGITHEASWGSDPFRGTCHLNACKSSHCPVLIVKQFAHDYGHTVMTWPLV